MKRKIEGLELGHENMKGDIYELKGVMEKMMEMMQALATKEDPHQRTMISKIIGPSYEPRCP